MIGSAALCRPADMGTKKKESNGDKIGFYFKQPYMS